jgi:hypothetical protein
VATVPAFRRRGLASAVTAGWATHPDFAGVMRFYSTHHHNVASQRVARGLGLRYIGASFRVG